MTRPLDGVKVLDFSTLLPGPLASLFLAEAGAEVIKIEPPSGEGMRRYQPRWGGESASFAMLNRGKKSLAIDLKSPDALAKLEPQGVLLGSAAAEADERVEVVGLDVLENRVGHVHPLAADFHPMRFFPARPENRASEGENARQRLPVEADRAVLHQPLETVAEPDHAHLVGVDRRLADAAYGRVEARGVTA